MAPSKLDFSVTSIISCFHTECGQTFCVILTVVMLSLRIFLQLCCMSFCSMIWRQKIQNVPFSRKPSPSPGRSGCCSISFISILRMNWERVDLSFLHWMTWAIYMIMNKLRYLYILLLILSTLSNSSACAPKHFETPCLTFCKAFTLSLIKIEAVSIKPKSSCT